MHLVDDSDQNGEDQGESQDSFVYTAEIEEKAFHAKGKRYKQCHIEQHAEEYVVLGFLDLDVNSGGEGQRSLGRFPGWAVVERCKRLPALLQFRQTSLFQTVDAGVEDAVGLEVVDSWRQ